MPEPKLLLLRSNPWEWNDSSGWVEIDVPYPIDLCFAMRVIPHDTIFVRGMPNSYVVSYVPGPVLPERRRQQYGWQSSIPPVLSFSIPFRRLQFPAGWETVFFTHASTSPLLWAEGILTLLLLFTGSGIPNKCPAVVPE